MKKIVEKAEKNGHGDVDAKKKKKGDESGTVKPRHVVVDPTVAAATTQVLAPVANTVLMSNERWICPFCSFNNAARNTQCGGHGPLGCNAPRTAAGAMGGMQGSQSQVAQAQRWVCSQCAFRNAGRNTQCGGTGPLGCNTPRQYADPTFAMTMGGYYGATQYQVPSQYPAQSQLTQQQQQQYYAQQYYSAYPAYASSSQQQAYAPSQQGVGGGDSGGGNVSQQPYQ